MARKSEQLTIVLHELLAAGVEGVTVEVGRKHTHVRWIHGGRSMAYHCAKTPSDHRAAANCRCSIRRMLRRCGLIE